MKEAVSEGRHAGASRAKQAGLYLNPELAQTAKPRSGRLRSAETPVSARQITRRGQALSPSLFGRRLGLRAYHRLEDPHKSLGLLGAAQGGAPIDLRGGAM